jgi:hypothetical protein
LTLLRLRLRLRLFLPFACLVVAVFSFIVGKGLDVGLENVIVD